MMVVVALRDVKGTPMWSDRVGEMGPSRTGSPGAWPERTGIRCRSLRGRASPSRIRQDVDPYESAIPVGELGHEGMPSPPYGHEPTRHTPAERHGVVGL